MEYGWEKDLIPYATKDKIGNLKQEVTEKIRKGQIKKWALIVGDFLFLTMIFLVLCVFNNIFEIKIDIGISFMNGIIAFEMAVLTFLSPIQNVSLKKTEVDELVGTSVTGDIMNKISKTIEAKTSNIQKWFALIGACGVFATVILKIVK